MDDVQMEHALKLSSKGYLHAALERFQDLLASETLTESAKQSVVHDEIGKILVQQNQFDEARRALAAATASAVDLDHQAKCQIHLAMTYHAQGDYDRAYRLLIEIDNKLGPELMSARRGVLFNNLASIQWATQFYRDAVQSMLQSLEYFEAAGVNHYHGRLYYNLGVCYSDLREFDTAEMYIRKALEHPDDEGQLFSYIALSRMYLESGNYDLSIEYAMRSVPLFHEVPQSGEPLKTAYMCRILGELACHCGDMHLAQQLMEKAELQFGVAGQWRDFAEARNRISEWRQAGLPKDAQLGDTTMMRRFLLIIEAWNTQEFLCPKFAEFIDTRVMYAGELADKFQLSEDDKARLITAARLADYGLTAIDPDVVSSPLRSDSAWQQYQQHPLLSAEMLRELDLQEEIYILIASHHQRADGTGYPRQSRTGFDSGAEVAGLAGGAGGAAGAGIAGGTGSAAAGTGGTGRYLQGNDSAGRYSPGKPVADTGIAGTVIAGKGMAGQGIMAGNSFTGKDITGRSIASESSLAYLQTATVDRDTLNLSLRILQLSDAYADSVVLHQKLHSEAIEELRAHKSGFDPLVLAAFEQLFQP
jgi:tetratricopeptide (TPR) repeat protein